MASPNGLALGLELLAHAGVPPKGRAAALRAMAEVHNQNMQTIGRTPTGAGAEIEAVCQAMAREVDAMRRAATQFERQAADEAAALEALPTAENTPGGVP